MFELRYVLIKYTHGLLDPESFALQACKQVSSGTGQQNRQSAVLHQSKTVPKHTHFQVPGIVMVCTVVFHLLK